MRPIPRDPSPDSTLALLRDPYGFIPRRAQRFGSDAFETRILFRPTICLTGPDAVRLFYDEQRFRRRGAAPGRLKKTLFGRGGVQGLDGAAHRYRKAMFLELLGPGRFEGLVEETRRAWRRAQANWPERARIVVYDEAREVLARAVCAWSGVPLPEAEVGRRTRQLTALFDGAGAVGPRHWRARIDRKRANRWAATAVGEVRRGVHSPPRESVLARVAGHRDSTGGLLPPEVAAVELLNVLRPTVAIAVYVALAAHALTIHSRARRDLAGGDGDALHRFVQEVRRSYPFFPAVAARVRRTFVWRDMEFPEGRRTLLDLFGTDLDPRVWDDPERFDPSRFRGRDHDAYELVPQGGGAHATGHRCAGEWVTIRLMEVSVAALLPWLERPLPAQDLAIATARLPALPRSGVTVTGVRAVGAGRPI